MPAENDELTDFGNIDEINTMISKIVKEMIASNTASQNENLMYEFNIRVDKNGISLIENYNNEPANAAYAKKSEPLIDIIERQNEMIVMAEMPGMDKKRIRITLDDAKLDISANGQNPYRKSLSLPYCANPIGSKASYNNGILEVVLKKGSYKGKCQIRMID